MPSPGDPPDRGIEPVSPALQVDSLLLSLQKLLREGINQETRTDTYTLLYIQHITKKDLLCSPGNSTHRSVKTYMGNESKEEWLYEHV